MITDEKLLHFAYSYNYKYNLVMCDFFSSNKLKEVEKAQRKTHETNATYNMVASTKKSLSG